jgi:hypothetical protein
MELVKGKPLAAKPTSEHLLRCKCVEAGAGMLLGTACSLEPGGVAVSCGARALRRPDLLRWGRPGGGRGQRAVLPSESPVLRVTYHPPAPPLGPAHRWAEGTSFALDAALSICRGLAAALAYLHSLRICHGDVYAHNVLYCPDSRRAVLCDFGALDYHRAGGWLMEEVAALPQQPPRSAVQNRRVRGRGEAG